MGLFNSTTVLITGGANGIGKGLVKAFRQEDATVIFFDVNHTAGKEVATKYGAEFHQVDVSDQKQLEAAMDDILHSYNDIDILINNVGVSEFKPLTEISIDEFDRVININLRSTFITSRTWVKHRHDNNLHSKYGRIVNIASTRWLQSEPHSEAYAASKGGIVAMTHALALSLSDFNITANSIAPGWINTNEGAKLTAEDHTQHPSRRVGKVEDVANTVFFLCDKRNDFVNGENIVVDGGMTKKMIYTE